MRQSRWNVSTAKIYEGERIARMIFTPCGAPDLSSVDTLDRTARGEGGFGSTGIR